MRQRITSDTVEVGVIWSVRIYDCSMYACMYLLTVEARWAGGQADRSCAYFCDIQRPEKGIILV